MNKPESSVKLYQVLLYLSLTYIIVCLFLPLSTSCEYLSDEEFVITQKLGALSTNYYVNILAVLSMLIASFTESGSRTALILIFTLSAGYVLVINFFSSAGWGSPCGNSPTIYQYALYLADLVFFIACLEGINYRRKEDEDEKLD